MLGPGFALSLAVAVLVLSILAAASVREQPRPLVGVHGLRWVVVHGLWRPTGMPGLPWWLLRLALLYGLSYPMLSLGSGIGALPARLPDLLSVLFVGSAIGIAAAAVLGAPWWSSELAAGADGLRVTGRWPRTPTVVPWSAVTEVRVVGRDLIIEGPEERMVLSMAWGPKALLVDVAAQLEATRLSAVPTVPAAIAPPPPELDALLDTARGVERVR